MGDSSGMLGRRGLSATTVAVAAMTLLWASWSTAETSLRLSRARAANLTRAESLEEVRLRGYGAVSGTRWAAPNGDSVLEIACDSTAHARLLHAKYLSDLHTFPGIEVATTRLGRTRIEVHEVRDQGAIAALRSGDTVYIAASGTSDGVRRLLGTLRGSWRGVASSAEIEVPMWLNRWDRYGFRFYYSPFMWPSKEQMPEGREPQTHDQGLDFEFARKHGTGLVVWNTLSRCGNSEGVTNEGWWSWIQHYAKPMGIPLAINTSAYNFEIPNWVANRYRSELALQMPQFFGDSMTVAFLRGPIGKVGELVWGATEARDAAFAALQQTVRRWAKEPNVVSWLEPHGEFYCDGDVFCNYGPSADVVFQGFLRKKYGTIRELNKAWGTRLRSWRSIRTFEIGDFAGWGPQAMDLWDEWRVGYPEENKPDLEKWFAEDFDDSKWATMDARKDDRTHVGTPIKPAVYRRTFDLPAGRFRKGERVWLYLWDLNVAWGKPVIIWMNGKKLSETHCQHPLKHWTSVEVTDVLRRRGNKLAIYLPMGYIAYRIYLTPDEPKQYPALGKEGNTKWADYVQSREAARMDSARRGVEMIREVDPDRQIDFMAPHQSCDGLKGLAEKYGANFKDTGFMSGCWADLLPCLMRGSGLPFSLEPGNAAPDPTWLRIYTGNWLTEGITGADYFHHIGAVTYSKEMRDAFEKVHPLLKMLGKYHCPKADVAFLWTMMMTPLTDFPWGSDLNTNLPSGWAHRGVFGSAMSPYPRDSITESDFARGNAAKYKVIVDTNTGVMDEAFVGEIEKYCRDGGTFVTLGQTGRHTPAEPNSWPISRLTGYEVVSVERFDANGHTIGKYDPALNNSPTQPLSGPAPGQDVYTRKDDWMNSGWLTGLRLKKVAPEAQDLILWRDGTVAVGMRRIGKGRIVEFGCKNDGPGVNLPVEAYMPIMRMAGVKMRRLVPDVLTKDGDGNPIRDQMTNEYISNNGLYDVWAAYNMRRDGPTTELDLAFKDGKAKAALDVLTGKDVPLVGGTLKGVRLAPLDTRVYLAPRHRIGEAPLEWFRLQRQWWKGTTPVSKPFPKFAPRFTHVITDDWAWHAIKEGDPVEEWAAPGFDDSKWERMPLGIWTSPEHRGVQRGFFRKTITIPREWDKGCVRLWMKSEGYPDYMNEGRVFLDGKQFRGFGAEGPSNALDGQLKAGEKHTLAVDIRSRGTVSGLPGACWLTYLPDPERAIDLSGTWRVDGQRDVKMPGPYQGGHLWREFKVPRDLQGKRMVFVAKCDRPFYLFINRHYIRFAGGPHPGGIIYNITPFVEFGETNEIELMPHYNNCPVRYLAIHAYGKEQRYP